MHGPEADSDPISVGVALAELLQGEIYLLMQEPL